jgi:cell division protein FtsB
MIKRMALKKNKKSAWKSFYSQFFLTIIGLFLILLICFPLYRHVRQRRIIDNEIAKLRSEIKNFEEKNSKLKELVDYLKSDEFFEEQARLKLGLAKEGEKVFIIKKEDQNAQNEAGKNSADYFSAGELDGSGTRESNFSRWLRYFFH